MMNISATASANVVEIQEPVSHEVRFEIVQRYGEDFADLNRDDLNALWEKLPHGASRTERGEIEWYLCEVAEHAAK